jgi:hypothetical protein
MKVLLQVTNGSGGVIVRYRDETDFVAVVIEPEFQTYRLLRRDGTTFQELSSGTSESLKRGDAIQNELTVTVVGADITITINGVATDPVTVEGISDSARFGMIAVPTTSDADVYVDHITIRKP